MYMYVEVTIVNLVEGR